MSAEKLFVSLPRAVQDRVLRRALALHSRPERPVDDPYTIRDLLDCSSVGYDDAALRTALIEHWRTVSTMEIARRLDVRRERRVREVAVLAMLTSVAHLATDERVATCLRVRAAWITGDATAREKEAAMLDAERAFGWLRSRIDAAVCYLASRTRVSDAASAFPRVVGEALYRGDAGRADWAWDALAAPLRELYSDPTRIDWREALRCQSAAIALMRSEIVGTVKPASTLSA